MIETRPTGSGGETGARSGVQASRGLWWATAMLTLEVFELLVLAEIVFADRGSLTSGSTAVSPLLRAYLAGVAVTTSMQCAGIALVLRGRYRLGGALQIAASALHVLKLEGLIGVVGGLQAYRFRRRDTSAS